MALHEQCIGATSEWYTPPHVFKAMGVLFDQDVAHPGNGRASWVPAKQHITKDSLETRWNGFVWMNPPFGGRNGIVPWLDKFFSHRNGVALTPDRTSAPWWQEAVLKADVILFVGHKLKFIDIYGNPGLSPAQGTTLMAVGSFGTLALRNAEKAGLGINFSRPFD